MRKKACRVTVNLAGFYCVLAVVSIPAANVAGREKIAAANISRPSAGPEKLQGIWIAESGTTTWSRIRIAQDVVVVDLASGQAPVYGYIQVNADAVPAQIDFFLEHRGTALGIYSLAGETLTLGLNTRFNGTERPSVFSSGEAVTLMVLTRRPAIEQAGPEFEEPKANAPAADRSARPGSKAKAIELPLPTGDLGIGRAAYHGLDASRDEMSLDRPQHFRELMIHVYYPIDRTATGKRASYFPALSLTHRVLGEAALKDDFGDAYASVFSVRSHSLAGSPLSASQKTYPVIVFLPGQGPNSTQYAALIEDLVSRGYIVAGIEPSYYASAVVFPGARLIRFASSLWEKALAGPFGETVDFNLKINDLLAADAIFVLDQLERLNSGVGESPLAGRLDLDRVGIMGHSIGGRAAALACQRDPRFRGCLSLDGFALAMDAYGNFGGTTSQQPYMLLRPEFPEPSENILSAAKMTRRNFRDWKERSWRRRRAFYERVQSGGYEAAFDIAGADHGSFADFPLLSPSDDPAAVKRRLRAMEVIRSYSRAFFDRVLRHKETKLLDAPSPDFPEVMIRRFGAGPLSTTFE